MQTICMKEREKNQNKNGTDNKYTLQENVLLVTKKFVTKNPAFRH